MGQERELGMTAQEFAAVVRYFKDENKTVHDLNELFKQGTAGQEKISGEYSVSYLDAVVEFICRALGKDDEVRKHYCTFRSDVPQSTVYRNAGKYISGKGNDITIFQNWNGYLQKNALSITYETKLNQILKGILAFLQSNYHSTGQRLIEFLRKVQSGASLEDFIEDQAMKLISGAVEDSTKKCVIFTGAPGTGKTYCVEEYVKDKTGQDGKDGAPHPDWEFVQFHSSFDYTDFVEGLRPIPSEGNMQFVRVDGIFKSFCRRAAADSDRTYYFIIDEINRADLGRVFGELMYCFEKRGPEHRVKTQYHNLPTAGLEGEDLFANGFYLPENVVILGTMNDIDRSVETFDFALRRRFDWVEVDANTVMHSSLKSMADKGKLTGKVTEELVGRIKTMNEIIADKPGLGPEFAIGPSYFEGYDGEENLEEIWERNIRPILLEYMRGRKDPKEFEKECKDALFRGTKQN